MCFEDKEISVLGIFPCKSRDLDWEALGEMIPAGILLHSPPEIPFIQDMSLAEL